MRTPHNERVASAIFDEPVDQSLPASGPERRCILSGEVQAKDTLIRLAISPDGDVLPDLLARAPGRGAWLGVTRAELQAAMAKGRLRGALARAFKGSALRVPDELPEMIEAGLRKLLLDRLGLELRAGKVVMGSDRIAEQARMGRIAALLHACDASEDGSKKLDQAWRVGREAEGSGQRGITLPLDRMALSVALGRDNVVHLALSDQGSADRVDAILLRLLHFLKADDAVENTPRSGMSTGNDVDSVPPGGSRIETTN